MRSRLRSPSRTVRPGRARDGGARRKKQWRTLAMIARGLRAANCTLTQARTSGSGKKRPKNRLQTSRSIQVSMKASPVHGPDVRFFSGWLRNGRLTLRTRAACNSRCMRRPERLRQTSLDRYAERSPCPHGVTKTTVRVANLVRTVDDRVVRTVSHAAARVNRAQPGLIIPCGAIGSCRPNGTPMLGRKWADLGNRGKPRGAGPRH